MKVRRTVDTDGNIAFIIDRSDLPIEAVRRHYEKNKALCAMVDNIGGRASIDNEYKELIAAYNENKYKTIEEELLDIIVVSMLAYKKLTE